MKFNEEHVWKVLNRIQSEVPQDWRDRVVEEVKATPTVEMVVDKAIEDENFNPELKQKLIHLKETGEFSKMKYRENPKYKKLINDFVTRRINQEIKKGTLPTKKAMREYVKNKKAGN